MEESGKRIVSIIDNDESILRALQRLLGAAGFEVRTYQSAQAFLESAFQQEMMCLVIDVRMPGMSGLELSDKLTDMNCRLPIIFITAYDMEKTRRKAIAAGAVGYFRKPVDGQALIDSIHWAFSARR